MSELIKFDTLENEIKQFVAPALTVKIASREDCDKAQLSAKQIKHFEKLVEARRKELVGPLNEQVKRINEAAKYVSAPLEKAEKYLKTELISWENKLEAEREKERKRLEEEHRKERERLRAVEEEREREAKEKETADALFGTLHDVPNPVALPEPLVSQEQLFEERARIEQKAVEQNRVKGTQKVWSFRIMDGDKVPRQYCITSDALIRAAVRDGVREIPGVEIFEEIKVSIR